MRLIDADKLIEYIVNTPSKVVNGIPYEQTMFSNIQNRLNEIIDAIEDAPTAYDIDKIVEQLEEEKEKVKVLNDMHQDNTLGDIYCDGQIEAYKYAIEIVKKGGAE